MKVLLIVYDNDSYIHFFPQGIAYIAAALRKEGHEVEIYNQDIHHYGETHLRDYLDNTYFDLVGLGFCAGYYQYSKCLAISRAVNKSKNRLKFIYVLGGHGPSAEPEYFVEKLGADKVIKGEGEKAICDFAQYQDHALWTMTPPVKNVDSIPWPAYDLFPIEIYRLIRWPTSKRTDFCMPILTGRGCKWHCNFCYRMDEGFRPREPEAVIEEMKYLNKTWGITHFQFSDELFMSSEDRIWDFCSNFDKYDVNEWIKWDCNGRLNFAKPEILGHMKYAGCQYINYGIEAVDDQVLKNMNKGLTVDQIHRGVQATIDAGITPGLNIIWGNIGDDLKTLEKGVDFLVGYNGTSELRTIRPVTPYPGSPLYFQAIEQGLLEGPADFYEQKHINSDLLTVNFTDLTDNQFHEALMDANQRLILDHNDKKTVDALNHARAFYVNKNVNFRGFRAV